MSKNYPASMMRRLPLLKKQKVYAIFGDEPDVPKKKPFSGPQKPFFGMLYVPIAAVSGDWITVVVDTGAVDYGATVGVDAKGAPVRIGAVVKHRTKYKFKNGIVLRGGMMFNDEPAAIVKYPQDPKYINRFSRMIVVGTAPAAKVLKAQIAAKIKPPNKT